MTNYEIPNNITTEAYTYMCDVIEQLKEAKLLASVDNAALNMLAYQYNIFIMACQQLQDEDLVYQNSAGNYAPNPLLQIIKNSQAACFKVMQDFGLTAKSRTKLPSMQEEDDSPLEQFVKGQMKDED